MNIKAVKAYLINVSDRSITDIEIKDWTQISHYIGDECDYFTCPISWPNGDTIYADDEGLFHSIEGGIMIDSFSQIIVGNVVVLGTNLKTGDSTDVKFKKEDIAKLVTFLTKEQAKGYAGKIRNTASFFTLQ